MHGSGTVKRLLLDLAAAMNASIKLLVSVRTSASSRATSLGANRGSSSLRNLRWSGGSIWSGINGRTLPSAIASMSDENISGLRSACMTSS